MKTFFDDARDVVLIGAKPQPDRIAASILWFDRGIVGRTRTVTSGDESFTIVLPEVAIGQDSSKIFLNKHLYYV